jgi:hypothetical protein
MAGLWGEVIGKHRPAYVFMNYDRGESIKLNNL